MTGAPPDLVDCVRLAAAGAVVERVYPLARFERLADVLAEPRGQLKIRVAFERLGSDRFGATLAVEAAPRLVCQRCLQAFDLPVNVGSRVEFTEDEGADAADADREICKMTAGRVSLAELAEEELLLAVPVAPICADPARCGRRSVGAVPAIGAPSGEPPQMRRPFAGLQDLLKKT